LTTRSGAASRRSFYSSEVVFITRWCTVARNLLLFYFTSRIIRVFDAVVTVGPEHVRASIKATSATEANKFPFAIGVLLAGNRDQDADLLAFAFRGHTGAAAHLVTVAGHGAVLLGLLAIEASSTVGVHLAGRDIRGHAVGLGELLTFGLLVTLVSRGTIRSAAAPVGVLHADRIAAAVRVALTLYRDADL
jgi:hypothetical protein